MRVGTMFVGSVDEVDGQGFQTKFFVLGLPLFPLESFYVIEETYNGIQGFSVGLHGKSVLFGYLRWGAALAVIGGGALWMTGSSPLLLGLAAIAWAVVTFGMGGASKEDAIRRRALGETVGILCPPEHVPMDVASAALDDLKERWVRIQVATDGADWEEIVAESPAALPFVHALAAYSDRCGEPGWHGVADATLEKLAA